MALIDLREPVATLAMHNRRHADVFGLAAHVTSEEAVAEFARRQLGIPSPAPPLILVRSSNISESRYHGNFLSRSREFQTRGIVCVTYLQRFFRS